MSSSVHVDNKGNDILILGQRPTQGLDDTTLTAEAKYSANFTQSKKKFTLRLHYNENKGCYLLMLQKHQFKANDYEIENYTLCLGYILKDLTSINMKKQD